MPTRSVRSTVRSRRSNPVIPTRSTPVRSRGSTTVRSTVRSRGSNISHPVKSSKKSNIDKKMKQFKDKEEKFFNKSFKSIGLVFKSISDIEAPHLRVILGITICNKLETIEKTLKKKQTDSSDLLNSLIITTGLLMLYHLKVFPKKGSLEYTKYGSSLFSKQKEQEVLKLIERLGKVVGVDGLVSSQKGGGNTDILEQFISSLSFDMRGGSDAAEDNAVFKSIKTRMPGHSNSSIKASIAHARNVGSDELTFEDKDTRFKKLKKIALTLLMFSASLPGNPQAPPPVTNPIFMMPGVATAATGAATGAGAAATATATATAAGTGAPILGALGKVAMVPVKIVTGIAGLISGAGLGMYIMLFALLAIGVWFLVGDLSQFLNILPNLSDLKPLFLMTADEKEAANTKGKAKLSELKKNLANAKKAQTDAESKLETAKGEKDQAIADAQKSVRNKMSEEKKTELQALRDEYDKKQAQLQKELDGARAAAAQFSKQIDDSVATPEVQKVVKEKSEALATLRDSTRILKEEYDKAFKETMEDIQNDFTSGQSRYCALIGGKKCPKDLSNLQPKTNMDHRDYIHAAMLTREDQAQFFDSEGTLKVVKSYEKVRELIEELERLSENLVTVSKEFSNKKIKHSITGSATRYQITHMKEQNRLMIEAAEATQDMAATIGRQLARTPEGNLIVQNLGDDIPTDSCLLGDQGCAVRNHQLMLNSFAENTDAIINAGGLYFSQGSAALGIGSAAGSGTLAIGGPGGTGNFSKIYGRKLSFKKKRKGGRSLKRKGSALNRNNSFRNSNNSKKGRKKKHGKKKKGTRRNR